MNVLFKNEKNVRPCSSNQFRRETKVLLQYLPTWIHMKLTQSLCTVITSHILINLLSCSYLDQLHLLLATQLRVLLQYLPTWIHMKLTQSLCTVITSHILINLLSCSYLDQLHLLLATKGMAAHSTVSC
jgi:hypothetical protein